MPQSFPIPLPLLPRLRAIVWHMVLPGWCIQHPHPQNHSQPSNIVAPRPKKPECLTYQYPSRPFINVEALGPQFNVLWDTHFKDKPNKLVMFCSIVSGAYADYTLLPPDKYITMNTLLVAEKIHISSSSPYVTPSFDSGFMNDRADFALIRWRSQGKRSDTR
ncbi:hypothetical protein D9757_012408 [Collybiopsis confluens]|uniref:Uncharacterized protein n=1 Tax=Collybiopsis confluens TaxID=2823264 RepID=A0A8H5H050_9AGAR|nr:hypothetical protein D9757_012408 [Collybiopsis confluens]